MSRALYFSLQTQAKFSRQLKSVNKDAKRSAVALRDQALAQNDIGEPEEYFKIDMEEILEKVRLYKHDVSAADDKEQSGDHEQLVKHESLMETVIQDNKKLEVLAKSVWWVMNNHLVEFRKLWKKLDPMDPVLDQRFSVNPQKISKGSFKTRLDKRSEENERAHEYERVVKLEALRKKLGQDHENLQDLVKSIKSLLQD